MAYTVENFRTAYLDHAREIATDIMRDAYDFAKSNPDSSSFEKKMYVHMKIANEIDRLLRELLPEFDICMLYRGDKGGNSGMATYNIDWSRDPP